MPLLDPRHLAGGGIERGLPVHESREGSDRLSCGVRVRGVDRVDAAQRAGTGLEDRGGTRGVRARDDVLARIGQTDTISILDQGVVPQLLARGSVVDPGGERVGATRRGKGVEDGRLTPVAVEAGVGHGQVGLGRGLRGEAHETVEEGAIGRIVRDVGSELATRGDINTDGRLTVSRHGDRCTLTRGGRRARVGDVHAFASPVRGLAGKEPAVDDLREGLRVQAVGGFDTGEVMQGDVKVPSVGPVTQVRLGARLLGGTDDGRVHGRGRGSQDVRQARALLARGVEDASVLERVDDGGRRAHDEVLDDVDLLARAHGREQRIVLDALQDDGADTRHLRGCHGRAGHELVGASGHGRVDVAAGGGDLGLEAQVRGDAPRGEARHGVLRAGGHDLAGGDAQAVVGGGQHGLAVGLRDERSRHAVRRQAHDHERVTGHVVVHNEAGGLGAGDVVELVLEGERTALDQHDLAREALGVLGLQGLAVLGRTDAAVDVLEGAAGQVGQVGHLLAVGATGALVGDVSVADREGAVCQRVVDRGHGYDGRVGRRFAQDRGVRVGDVGQVLTGQVAVSGRVLVAGGRVHGHARILEALEHGGVHGVGLVIHAAGLSEGQVDDVRAQDHHVVKGGEQRRVRDAAVAAAGDLGDDDLRVGRDAHDFARVARGDAGDVRAVRSGFAGRRGVRVVIRVVVCEGELFRHVAAGLAVAQLGGQGRHLVR